MPVRHRVRRAAPAGEPRVERESMDHGEHVIPFPCAWSACGQASEVRMSMGVLSGTAVVPRASTSISGRRAETDRIWRAATHPDAETSAETAPRESGNDALVVDAEEARGDDGNDRSHAECERAQVLVDLYCGAQVGQAATEHEGDHKCGGSSPNEQDLHVFVASDLESGPCEQQ